MMQNEGSVPSHDGELYGRVRRVSGRTVGKAPHQRPAERPETPREPTDVPVKMTGMAEESGDCPQGKGLRGLVSIWWA